MHGPSLGGVPADTWEAGALVVKTIQHKIRFTGKVFVLRVNVVGHGSRLQVAGWIYNLRAKWTVNAFSLGFTKMFGGLREGYLAKPPTGREHLGGHAVQQCRRRLGRLRQRGLSAFGTVEWHGYGPRSSAAAQRGGNYRQGPRVFHPKTRTRIWS